MGVVKAHMETEHNTDDVQLDMAALCPKCDLVMEPFSIQDAGPGQKRITYRHCNWQYGVVSK